MCDFAQCAHIMCGQKKSKWRGKIQRKSSLAAVPSQRKFALARIIVCCGASIVAHFARKVRAPRGYLAKLWGEAL